MPKLVLVCDGLCELIKFEVPLENDEDGSLTTEWENARMEIANTFTKIANEGALEMKD